MLQSLSPFIVANHLGELISLLGLLISVFGFSFTIWQVMRSKSAADAAKRATVETQKSIKELDIVIEFSSALTMMEEIKDRHRKFQWESLPTKYSLLRQKLISIKSNTPNLKAEESARLQESIQQFSSLERKIDDSLVKQSSPNLGKFNNVVNDQIDALTEMLSQIRKRMEVK